MTKTRQFDASEYLTSPEIIAEYLNAAIETGEPELFCKAIGDIAKAKGMTSIAEETGLGRESLYKALSDKGTARFSTLQKVTEALGLKFQITRA